MRLTTLIGIAALYLSASAQLSTFPATPLASKHFAYPTGIPYQADSDNLIRGTQTGYNQCNSTTEGPSSLCQTSFLNSADDFCLWAPIKPSSSIADTEGEEVAWCTKPGRGTRLIPAGALKGVQFIKTPDYVQVVGFIDQAQVNIAGGDFGGELDPHGADLRGNPLGGLFYSTAFSGNNNTYQQVIEWTNFMGGDAFCLKACNPAGSNAASLCQHIYDRIGCFYNMPNQAQNGTFESCLGENQDPPGVYTDSAGAVQTYTQPPEGVEPTPASTYTPKVPASSSCTSYDSMSLFAALASVTGSATATTSGASASGTATTSSKTTTTNTPGSNSADVVAIGSGVSFLGVIFSALFLS